MTWHHIGAKPLSKPMMSQFYKAYSFNELTDLPLDKMAAISQTIFSDAFYEWKVLYFD